MNLVLLFLDMDGVLNEHEYDPDAQSCSLSRQCVSRLNRVLRDTDAQLVISSAWRYMVTRNAMTLTGFEYLLRTHRVQCVGRVHGVTRESVMVETSPNVHQEEPRGLQILDYVAAHKPTTWAVVDDLELELGQYNDRHVKTAPKFGLQDADADRLIKILRGRA